MTVHSLGDQALLVSFEQTISHPIHQQVIGLKTFLQQKHIAGVRYFIPAYCSLTIGFDPLTLSVEILTSHLSQFEIDSFKQHESIAKRHLQIPVCYEDAFAPDMQVVVEHSGLSPQKIIELHSSNTFTVFMLGFIPGFAYMGILPIAIRCPRKTSPRLRVPAGSVGLAGAQTGIYPAETPGGWQLIGRCPIPMFDPARDSPSLVEAGDKISFCPISAGEFEHKKRQLSQDTFDYGEIYG